MRRADHRLSNCVLEGGRSKSYGPPPPPPEPDVDVNVDLRDGWDPVTSVIVGILLFALFATIVAMVALGCDPLRCP
jgi:hypothetical protein